MSIIGSYWTIEYVHPTSGIDETHVLKVVSERDGILATEGVFLSLNRTFNKNTLENTLKDNGRAATAEEIAIHEETYRHTKTS